MTPDEVIALCDSMRFPSNINYCDWERLSDEEKEKLWQQELARRSSL